MTRLKSILKILSVVLAVLLLAVCFAGCGEYTPPTGTGGGSAVTPPPDDPVIPDDSFTVTLTHYDGAPFTSTDYSLITKLQAQWTEITDGRPSIYRAYFNANGVASVGKLDGDFNVTLVLTSDFNAKYCYDPNPARPERRDELVASRYKKDVTVPLYKIERLGSSGNMNIGGTNTPYNTLTKTGAYSYTLQNEEDRHLFFYVPKISGEYSFMTLMDVTADEINPIVDLHYGMPGYYVNPFPVRTQDGGGAEGSYTKNVWLKYQQTADESGGSNGLIFNLYSESEKADAYPLTIYFIFERDGEFTRPMGSSTPVPVTEDFSKTPFRPAGTLELVGESSLFNNTPDTPSQKGVHILNQKGVEYSNPAKGGDGYYYYAVTDGDGNVVRYRLYAVITQPIPVLANVGMDDADAGAALNNVQLARGYYWMSGEDGTTKNYYEFIMGLNGYASHCNSDGAYPVNAELKQFLQDYAISERYFNDGNGFAEDRNGAAYDSDEDSQWLFACGIYV